MLRKTHIHLCSRKEVIRHDYWFWDNLAQTGICAQPRANPLENINPAMSEVPEQLGSCGLLRRLLVGLGCVNWCYLYLLQHVLELNQELLGIFSFVRHAVQSLRQLALQTQTETSLVSHRRESTPVS